MKLDCFIFKVMSRKYKFHNKSGLYFIRFATVYWVDVFTRQLYFSVLEDNLIFCRKEKGMEIYANLKDRSDMIAHSMDKNIYMKQSTWSTSKLLLNTLEFV
ncbi:hypothetical protein GCM10022258_19700 [Aquimarina gracilis]